MTDPDEHETPERLKAMAIMAAFDALPGVVRAAILTCEQQVSPFRARAMLAGGISANRIAALIDGIQTREDAASFHQVTPGFATGTPQPTSSD